jgi:predicted metalloendopeptidase
VEAAAGGRPGPALASRRFAVLEATAMLRRGIAVVLLLSLTACVPGSGARPGRYRAQTAPEPPTLSDPEPLTRVWWAVEKSNDPCDDFYAYACGSWHRTVVPPAGYRVWGLGFSELNERAQRALWQILTQPQAPADPPGLADARAFYAACIADQPGPSAAAPMAPLLAPLDSVHDPASFMRAVARLHTVGVPAVFDARVDVDPTEPTTAALLLTHGGLRLPLPRVYLSGGEVEVAVRKVYREHMTRMLELIEPTARAAEAEGARAYELEKVLAELAPHRLANRDPAQTFQATTAGEMIEHAPSIPWSAYFEELGLGPESRVVLDAPYFFDNLQRLFSKPENLRPYLRWHLVDASADLLDEAVRHRRAVLWATDERTPGHVEPRWSMCTRTTTDLYGDLLVETYQRSSLPAAHLEAARSTTDRVTLALTELVDSTAWSDAETTARAKEKLAAVHWSFGRRRARAVRPPRSHEGADHFTNTMTARQARAEVLLAAIGEPSDTLPAAIPPLALGATGVNLLTTNEIYLPAIILRRPVLDVAAPAAVNYGAFGFLVGHELMHAVDGPGRFFDGNGRMGDWWTPAVATAYEERASCVRGFYGNYVVATTGADFFRRDHYLDGSLTLHENLADIGGLRAAHRAFRAHVEEQPPAARALTGFTDEQVFFLAYAQLWCTVIPPEIEFALSLHSSHAPPRFRVNGAVSQVPEFAEAFSCAPATRMNPPDRCGVW